MKKNLLIATLLIIGGAIAVGTNVFASEDLTEETPVYTLEDKLVLAIEDEWNAAITYEAIIDTYGEVKPFTNIIQAELYHASLLEPLFEIYGVDLPEKPTLDSLTVPASLEEAFALGVDAEIANIALYESFIAQGVPEDVQAVFEQLIFGSEHHLNAFSRALDRSTNPCEGIPVFQQSGANKKGPQFKGGK